MVGAVRNGKRHFARTREREVGPDARPAADGKRVERDRIAVDGEVCIVLCDPIGADGFGIGRLELARERDGENVDVSAQRHLIRRIIALILIAAIEEEIDHGIDIFIVQFHRDGLRRLDPPVFTRFHGTEICPVKHFFLAVVAQREFYIRLTFICRDISVKICPKLGRNTAVLNVGVDLFPSRDGIK